MVNVLGELDGPYRWRLVGSLLLPHVQLSVVDDRDPFFVGIASRHGVEAEVGSGDEKFAAQKRSR